jgi:hypothetical protein
MQAARCCEPAARATARAGSHGVAAFAKATAPKGHEDRAANQSGKGLRAGGPSVSEGWQAVGVGPLGKLKAVGGREAAV